MDASKEIIRGFKDIYNQILSKKKNTNEPVKSLFYTRDFLENSNYLIGDYSYGRPNVLDWGEKSTLEIGKFCSISGNVTILLGGNHRVDWITTYPFSAINDDFPDAVEIKGHPSTKGDVIIGNDVWIGNGATILSGVTIGDGAVIGANAVISKNVNPYEIVVGNSGRTVKKRFSDKIIVSLLEIKWWDWPIEKINQEMILLCSEKIEAFIEKHTPQASM